MIARLSCRKWYRAVRGKGIVYQLVGEEGPDHNKSFRVEVVIGGEAFGCGIGRTKKAAEQEAAYQAILKLKEGKGTVGEACI